MDYIKIKMDQSVEVKLRSEKKINGRIQFLSPVAQKETRTFKIEMDIDNEYYTNYLSAKKAGVNFLAYRCNISSKKIFIEKKLKIINE